MWPENDIETIAIHESKNSDKVIRFYPIDKKPDNCSKRYWKQIVSAKENGSLWGAYLTKSGRIKATFI